MFTTDQKWTIALLKLLDDMNAPDYAFKAIMKWARAAKDDNYSFFPKRGLSRSKNVDILFQSMTNATQLLPAIQPVSEANVSQCDVIAFDFVPQLLKLLQNRKIMTQENLVIDVRNPLQQFKSPNGDIGEALSGSVYQDAYAEYIQNPDRELFVPIIQWIDRTSVTGNDRFSLKPYMFTPAIFKEKFRRKIGAWGYHGFLPKSRDSSAQNQTKPQGDNLRNYHAQLNVVLKTFQTANDRLKNVTLPLGPTGEMTVDIKTCILFIIQDMQEGDMLCGRYGIHTCQCISHCCYCAIVYCAQSTASTRAYCVTALLRSLDTRHGCDGTVQATGYIGTSDLLVLDCTVASYFDRIRQCLLTLLPQLLLSLKLLPQLHSCRSSIVRVKRYSYRFVRQSLQLIQQRAPLLFAATSCAILSLHTIHLLR